MKFLTFTVSLLLLATNAHALQIKQATDNAKITATLSAKEISRISVPKDRIRMSSGDENIEITNDSDSGDIYLKPKQPPLNKPLNLFITTEKGFTYQLLLVPKDIPSEQIIVRNEAVLGSGQDAQIFESKSPFHHSVIEVLKATIGSTPLPVGYTKNYVKKPTFQRQNQFEMHALYHVDGATLQGVAFQVQNIGDTSTFLTERDLFAGGQLAVYLSKRELKADETTGVYIVRLRTGDIQ